MAESESIYDRKLCLRMMARPDHTPDVETLKPLVRDARFICRNCGRAASDPDNLCNPTPLYEE